MFELLRPKLCMAHKPWGDADDAHEIAGRIVGGDQAKGRTAARREAVDKSVQRHVGIAVDADAYRLAGADMLELRLLEIRDHIKIGDGNDIERSEEHTSELPSLKRISYAVS